MARDTPSKGDTALETLTVPRPKPGKKPDEDKGEKTVQVNVRIPMSFVARLENAAEKLGIDRSNLLRIMIAEKLPEYEERARRAAPSADYHK
jgi:hypothetical protein